ncbi:MAG: mechanosensitive ion channel family protein [Sediminibacterium sp.]
MNRHFTEWLNNFWPWFLSHGIRIILIGLIAWLLHRYVIVFIRRLVMLSIVKDAEINSEAERKRKDTLTRIFSWAARIVILAMGALIILQELGVPIAPILAGAGIIGLALGFGGQYLIRDLISGFFIILENQYRIGDVVNLDGTGGLVEDISLRLTTLRDLDGTVHHIPHGEVKRVSNHSKYFSRVNINVGVSYNCKIDHVIEVVNRIGNEMAEDPLWKDSILKAPQFLRIDQFGDSSIDIKIIGETPAHKKWDVTGELRKRIKQVFDEEGIEIPFPQRVVHQASV